MIKYKTGVCAECLNGIEVPLIARLCNYHYWKGKSSPIKKKPVKINPISKKQAQALKEYRKVREEYFKEHPVCEFPGCESTEVELHHSRGRIGSLLTDKRYFKSLCRTHHHFAELNPIDACEMGLSASRLMSIDRDA